MQLSVQPPKNILVKINQKSSLFLTFYINLRKDPDSKRRRQNLEIFPSRKLFKVVDKMD